jgi:hypothetical protein
MNMDHGKKKSLADPEVTGTFEIHPTTGTIEPT